MARIETIRGNLRAVSLLEPGTFQHWDELSADQITDSKLRRQGFYVADYPQYYNEGGESYLSLARHTRERPNNLVLVHLFDEGNSSYDQLIQTCSFRPDPEEARAVLEAADTLKFKLDDLNLCGIKSSNSLFLEVRTADGYVRLGNSEHYMPPNEVEKAFLERAGCTEDFLGVLQREPYKISKTRSLVLNPDYVAQEAGAGFVGRVAWRGSFNGRASSDALDHVVINPGNLRGVRREKTQLGKLLENSS